MDIVECLYQPGCTCVVSFADKCHKNPHRPIVSLTTVIQHERLEDAHAHFLTISMFGLDQDT